MEREFPNNSLDILGVSEARWTGSGQRTLATGHTILYSGRSDGHHIEGVVLIMNRKIERTLIERKPSGSRLLKARFNSRCTKLTVIVYYAPIEDAEEADKDGLCDQLQAVLGDLNARSGTMEKGCVTSTIKNNMVIGGTLFQHRNIHKTTWISPNGAIKSQIDHILINGK